MFDVNRRETRTMTIAKLVLVFACVPLAAQQPAAPVAGSESREVVAAFASSGAVTLQAVHFQLDLNYPRGKKERRHLSVAFDPQSGHYMWNFAAFPGPADADRFVSDIKSHKEIVYADAEGLFDFVFRSDLWVKVFRLRASNLDDAAQLAVAKIQQGLASIESGYQPRTGPSLPKWPWDYRPVDLEKAIPAGFNCSQMRADCKDDRISIVSIAKQGGNWRLVLRNRWDQEIILDSDFKFVSTERLPEAQEGVVGRK